MIFRIFCWIFVFKINHRKQNQCKNKWQLIFVIVYQKTGVAWLILLRFCMWIRLCKFNVIGSYYLIIPHQLHCSFLGTRIVLKKNPSCIIVMSFEKFLDSLIWFSLMFMHNHIYKTKNLVDFCKNWKQNGLKKIENKMVLKTSRR